MVKPDDIESWIASSKSSEGNEDDELEQTLEWADVRQDWPSFLEAARRTLLSSRTRLRSSFLQEQIYSLSKSSDLSKQEVHDLFQLLVLTYPRYIDQESRQAVEEVLCELAKEPLSSTEGITGWVKTEARRICDRNWTRAAANRFVLLNWSCRLYMSLSKSVPSFETTGSWSSLVEAMALLLDGLLDECTNTKKAVRRAAIVICRRALRSTPARILNVINACLALNNPRATCLVGLACDVMSRLKNVPQERTVLPPQIKSSILQLYTTSILMSRTVVASHVTKSLDGYISAYVTEEDFKSTIISAMEKASLRSAEVALPTIIDFFGSYAHQLTTENFQRAVVIVMNAAKSSTPSTRSNAVSLAEVLLKKSTSTANGDYLAKEILGPARSGKTTGAEHRIALFTMLAFIAPSPSSSAMVVESVPSLIAKESNEAAQSLLAKNTPVHFVYLLKEGKQLPTEAMSMMTKEMGSSKPSLRKSMCCLVGSIGWECQGADNESIEAFIGAVLPPMEANLKAVATNPLAHPSGPLEGYIALACLLGPISGIKRFEPTVSKNATIQTLSGSKQKPSFLLWDKVYQKLLTNDEQQWLLRALRSSIPKLRLELEKHDFLRLHVGQAINFIATIPNDLETRRSAISTLEEENRQYPILMNKVMREAIQSRLPKTVAPAMREVDQTALQKMSRSASALLACACFSEDFTESEKESLIAELVLIAHHPALCQGSRQLWIELCQRAHVDPRGVATRHTTKLLERIVNVNDMNDATDASVRRQAVKTLVFVAPDVVIPALMQHVKADLDPKMVSGLSESDYAIWETPEGTTFVDVLSGSQKSANGKGKDADIQKWEAELRSSLAAKKTVKTPQTLSKHDKLLVDAQLKKESEVRERVATIRSNVIRGLNLLAGIIDAGVPEIGGYFLTITDLLLGGVLKARPSFLGQAGFDGYIDLSRSASSRLLQFRTWIGIATVRFINEEIIPEELRSEDLNSLVLRVSYRLRSLSEQSPFDCATFCYVSPLLSSIVRMTATSDKEEELLELIALTIELFKVHGAEFADTRFPRTRTLQDLLYIIKRHPTFGKDAASALVTVAEAMRDNAASNEIDFLLKSTVAQEPYVRNASLQCLQALDLTELDWSPELWIASYDNDQQNARSAHHAWEDNGLDVPESFFGDLKPFLDHEFANVRASCAMSLPDAVSQWPQVIDSIVDELQALYRGKAKAQASEVDEYGVVRSRFVERIDPWPARLAVAQSFEALAPLMTDGMVVPFMKFLVEEEVLGDSHSHVRSGMLNAAAQVIDTHGKRHIAPFTSMFEDYLSAKVARSETSDFVKEAVVVLLGRVARHMDAGDSRIPGVVSRLVEALKTPSEQVQVAVSECLAPLVPFVKSSLNKLVDDLLQQLFSGEKYAERRGAAYGIAGFVKGAGIASIVDFNLLDRVRSALEEKKRYEARQGAMFIVETLSSTLNRNFEPFIIELLPSLLSSFGDSSPDVREAAADTAKVIMGNLSGYGVKRLLPSLLEALEEKQWRTKKGSIELLGTMAFCAPKQLSISLPTVIPRLSGVLTDSHAQVRTSANKSLKQFGEVINNPEIQSLVPILLKALGDPAKTPNALASLLKTSFAHYIDSPSLALVMPIIERGLRERGSEIKRKAAQIVGNLASLTDSQDFVPYLSRLLPLVHVVLVDPVPEARATAAKALGTLVERLGEEQFPDMVPGLLRVLKTDSSGVDRQGAAQGLSEVLAGLGMDRLEALLPDIVSNAQSPRSTVREGFMSLLVFLPATFGVRFQPHLTKIVGPILAGLSDTEEYVREAAMKAGRMIINNYSSRAIDLLLPELERGMFDSSWRIRHSSITLVGELLFKVAGISGKADVDEDEEEVQTVVVEVSKKALGDALGKERRDRVLSALYIVRQDAVAVVRQSSIHIWKALVQNTPRTVRELLPELLSQLIQLLVDKLGDAQDTASRTIGELCRKLGERILSEILPVLRTNSTSPDSATREGSCLALIEIMESSSDAQREVHDDDIVAIVRASLVDDDKNVRAAAAQAFDSLQEHLGAKAIDQTIPTLLDALRQPGESSGTALHALKEVMSVRAHSVFPVLIPTLIAPPITVFNANAIASLVTVAGNALSKRLPQVLGALVAFSEERNDEELTEALDDAIRALLGSIPDSEGLNTLMMLLLGWAKTGSPTRRASSCRMFGIFCEESDLDDSMYRIDWVRQLISLLDDSEEVVHTSAWAALDIFIKSVPKDEYEPLVITLRRTVESTGAPGRSVPGFSLPKGVSPMVPVIIAGLTTGSNDQRENAAYAIGDLVTRTEEGAFKPFVVPFTGPLIRVAAQSTTYPPGVKSAITAALTTMLEHIPAFVKPFFPQLQRTFVKGVADPSSGAVRGRAATALGVLMRSQPRVDPVVTELIAGVKASEDAIAASHLVALAQVVKSAGANVGEKSRESCMELVEDAFKEDHEDNYMQAAGTLFAELSQFPDLVKPTISAHLVAGTPSSSLASHCILSVFERVQSDHDVPQPDVNVFRQLGMLPDVVKKVHELVGADRSAISRPAREARDLINKLEGL